MLEMRSFCECCGADLPAGSREALICSFECTFCAGCARGVLGGICPNCGGELAARPTRADALLVRHPVSIARIVKPEGCAPHDAETPATV